MNNNQPLGPNNDGLNLDEPIFVLKSPWWNMAGLTLIWLILLAIVIHKGMRHSLDAKEIKRIILYMILPTLASFYLMALMVKSKVALMADTIEFRYLFAKSERIEIKRLKAASLNTSGKTRTLNFLDDDKYSKEPLEIRADWYSKPNIIEFENKLRERKPDLEMSV